jgi:hypothetical protein
MMLTFLIQVTKFGLFNFTPHKNPDLGRGFLMANPFNGYTIYPIELGRLFKV